MAIRADEVEATHGAVDIDRDRRLVLRHQQGDVEAFDELYRRYHDRLVSYCARRVGDRHTAEELAQEAFVKALRAMPRFAGERRFYPWMTVIAQRLCIDHHRRSARVEPHPEPEPGLVEADHAAVFAAVDRDHLGLALDRLAPRHREILDLREQRGWSYQQIATHLDVPMTTVEALLHRARKALRREYLAVGGDDRGGRWGVALLGGGLGARVKAWLAGLGPERWGPILGSAAAGTLAIGMVAGPLRPGDGDAAPVEPVTTIATGTDDVGAEGGGSAPVTVALPAPPVAAPGSTSTAAPAPAPPLVENDVVLVATDPSTAEAAMAENQTQPVHLELPGVADVGLDSAEAIERLLTPGGNP
jgi:RNA polymerase sigma-70 factor (ECF subfamily)